MGRRVQIAELQIQLMATEEREAKLKANIVSLREELDARNSVIA